MSALHACRFVPTSMRPVTSVHAGVVSCFFSDGPQNTWLFALYEPDQCLMARISTCKILIRCDLN